MTRTCTRCILPDTYRNIEFDRAGVCNYCHDYDKHRDKITDYTRHAKLLAERFDRFRGQYEYDALVGLSGGKDSSYIAHALKNDFGLNVLTFTYDNGFLSEYARQNIALVVDKLGVDHFFYQPQWASYRDFYRKAVEKMGLPCLACALIGYISVHKLAFEREIPFAVHGRSPAQMFKEFTDGSLDAFLPFIANNLSPYSVEANKEASMKGLKRAMYFLEKVVGKDEAGRQFIDSALPDIDRYLQAEIVPEFLGFFLYQPYDELRMMARLEKDLGWRPPDSKEVMTHSDCLIHDAAAHMYYQVLEYPLLALELSVAIRAGEMSRDQGLARLQAEKALTDYPRAEYRILCEKLGLSESDLPKIVRKTRAKHGLLKRWTKLKYLFGKPPLPL